MEQQALFRRLTADTPTLTLAIPPNPRELLSHWHRICCTEEPALAAPYIEHSPMMPLADPSAVVRIITAQVTPTAPICVHQAWLEVPLGAAAVAFLTLDGLNLPVLGDPLTVQEQQALEHWQALLRADLPPCVAACLEAAVALHTLLPPIDQVAWDWIPAHPRPLLLEGNGCFDLLVPQLLQTLIHSSA
jgi:hypothetical protein